MLTTKPLSFFKTDPKQPRKQFTESDLLSLGASIKNLGQLQPVGGRGRMESCSGENAGIG